VATQTSTQITGIAFSELKPEKKKLITENLGKMLFCLNFEYWKGVRLGK
jgi:hypothetical protein